MKFLQSLTLVIVLYSSTMAYTQVVNGYARVTNVSGNTLTLSNVNESGDTFEDGQQVIVMQMQDDVIGGNTGNNANFGLLGSIQSAGLYEIRVIQSHTESFGSPTTITLDNVTNSYNTGNNSSVQIITFPELGSPDYTTTGNISALDWDGNIGGVVAFQVSGTLTLAHNISADAAGFRGASANGGGSTWCSGSSNYRRTSHNDFADKGEGIFRRTANNQAAGRARILSGGGGGNSHNAGGGGGSNFSAGGLGGPGWPNCIPTAGGMGGIDLSAHISGARIFMGGGGGAGEGNNGGSQDAGDGGGIVLMKANEVRTTGSCAGISISAAGESILNGSGGDGNSGGGAAGTVVMDVQTWNINNNCDLTISANGGNGGDVSHWAIHGAGGGGGQGATVFTGNQPTTNTTVETTPGNGGSNCNTCGDADDGSGNPNDGIISNTNNPLPVELLEFVASGENNYVYLDWVTATEINNDYFEVERSKDGFEWESIGVVGGVGNSNTYSYYNHVDTEPYLGTSYYRLKQFDFDGQFEYSNIASIVFDQEEEIVLYPNPSSSYVKVQCRGIENMEVKIFDATGKEIRFTPTRGIDKIEINTSKLLNGIYFVNIYDGQNISKTLKLQVLH